MMIPSEEEIVRLSGKKWCHQVTVVFQINDSWKPRWHWDYGGWYKHGRHNILLNCWLGLKWNMQISIGRHTR